MKKYIFFLILFSVAACQRDSKDQTIEEASVLSPAFALKTDGVVQYEYENLRLYPITAEIGFWVGNEVSARLVHLEQAIQNDKFRITEKKPFGRFNDRGAVNALTVQNRSQDTVFLMTGDVVQGGKQDRIIAQDVVIPPRTITDLSVFCVEPHRWQYQDETEAVIDDHSAQQDKKIFAFRGYYHVASTGIRKSVNDSRNQQEIWDKVGEVTAMHQAKTETGAYAGLEQSQTYTKKRDEYLSFYEEKFQDIPNVVGVVAVSGKEVLGADIFGHPNLFKRQYGSLLHSYVTDALSSGSKVDFSMEDARNFEQMLLKDFQENPIKRYTYQGELVHYFFAK